MGVIYLVLDTLMDNMTFALKTVKQELLAVHGKSLTDTLKNEYEIMTRLKHPNLTRVYEFGEDKDNYFIVMEYLEGNLLSDIKMGFDGIIEISVQILRALEYIHSRNIIYRDLKPANIIITNGIAKLMDFGISSSVDEQSRKISGSFPYMAPEALAGDIRFQTDIYSLGITIFELLAEKRYFNIDQLSAKMLIDLLKNKEKFEDYQNKALSHIPDNIRGIIKRMTNYDIKDRYDNCSIIIGEINESLGLKYEYETQNTKQSYVLGNPFANRKKELKSFIENISSPEKNRFILCSGPAGIGKTRLLQEFKRYCLLNNIDFFNINCLEGNTSHYYAIANALSKIILLSSESILEKYGKYLKLLLPAHKSLSNFQAPKIIDNPELLQDLIIQNISSFIYEISENNQRPIVIYIDDLQWLDAGSQLIIKKILEMLNDSGFNIFFYGNINTSRSKNIPGFLSIHGIKEYVLQQLEMEAVNEFIKNIFGMNSIEDSIINAIGIIKEKVGSNPLFLQELIKSLIDKDYIIKDKRLWKLQKPIENIHIPENIIEIIRDKLRHLYKDDNKRKILKILALIRIDLNIDIIKAIIEEIAVIDTAIVLMELVNLEILQISRLNDIVYYSYTSSLIKEEIRAEISNKNEISLYLAEKLESIWGKNNTDITEEIAYHYHQGGNISKAVLFYTECGDNAKENYFNDRALKYYKIALDLLKNEKSYETGIDLKLKMGFILDLIGSWNEALETYEDALKEAEMIKKTNLIIDCLCKTGHLLLIKSRFQEAEKKLQKALALAESNNYKQGISQSIGYIGNIYYYSGNYKKAVECYERKIEICKDIDNKKDLGRAFGNIGLVNWNQGNYGKAMDFYQKKLLICEELEDKIGKSLVMINIGLVFYYQGDYSKAMEFYQDALSICNDLGYKKGISRLSGNIGLIFWNQGEYHKAYEYFHRQLSICQELGDKGGISRSLLNIGNVYYYQQEYSKALENYEKYLDICKDLSDKNGIAKAIGNIGIVYCDQGYFQMSISYFKNQLRLCRELNDKYGISVAYGNLAIAYILMGNNDLAMDNCKSQLEISIEIGHKTQLSLAYGTMGIIYSNQNKFHEADSSFTNAIDISVQLKTKYELSGQLFARAQLYYEHEKIQEAEKFNKKALKTAEDIQRSDIIFKCKVLELKIKRDIKGLSVLINEYADNLENEASIYYEMWKLESKESYKSKALLLYQKLYKNIPKFEYKKRIDQMKYSSPMDT